MSSCSSTQAKLRFDAFSISQNLPTNILVLCIFLACIFMHLLPLPHTPHATVLIGFSTPLRSMHRLLSFLIHNACQLSTDSASSRRCNPPQMFIQKSASPALGLMHSLSPLRSLSTCTLMGPITLLRSQKKAVNSVLLMVRGPQILRVVEEYKANGNKSPLSCQRISGTSKIPCSRKLIRTISGTLELISRFEFDFRRCGRKLFF